MMEGLIIKGIGGFYYVEAAGQLYECRARGIFRKEKISPFAGDRVEFTLNETGENTVDRILERKNLLVRPPVANVDTLVIVSSVKEPVPSTLVIDKLTAIAVHKGIRPCVVFSKTDLGDTSELESIYRLAGIGTCSVCCKTGKGADEVRRLIGDGITVFTGNTGVGKSSLLNLLYPSLSLSTGEISEKLGRGRHTTREVTLFRAGEGYVADTPGFSSLEVLENNSEYISKEELPNCFPEFEPFLCDCKFTTCAHTVDKGCGVLKALSKGLISESRHKSYVEMYKEVKDIKEWQLR